MATTESAAHHDEHGHADDGAVHVHIAKAQFYWGVFAALVMLTIVTVAASYVDMGAANTIVAVLIATAKASLVAAFFMHLRHDRVFNTIAFVSSFIFLGVFLMMTADDLWKRGEVDNGNGTHMFNQTGEEAPGGLASAMVIPSSIANEHGGEHGGETHGAAPAPSGGHSEH
jgi:cytochrome c oxidase subunit 4